MDEMPFDLPAPEPLTTEAVSEPPEDPSRRIADGTIRKLQPAYYTVQLMGAWIFNGFAVVGLGVVALLSWIFEWLPGELAWAGPVAWVVLSAVICWLNHVYPRWEYDRARYRLTLDALEIRRGVIWRTIITVPRSRVQHTDVSQGPIQRRFAIATLTVHTAGTENASVELNGLAHGEALSIRDLLIQGREPDGV